MEEELLERVVRRIYQRRRGNVNYVKLKNLIRRFVELNPDADVESIDWMAVYDDTLEYDELIQAFEEQYPMHRWRQEAPMGQREYEDTVVTHVLSQVEDLSEESIKSLINALQERIQAEIQAEKEQATPAKEEHPVPAQVMEAPAETVQRTEAPRVVVNLRLLAKYPFLEEARTLVKAYDLGSIPEEAVGRARERVLQALDRGELGVIPRLGNPFVELVSFPTARAAVSAIDDSWLTRRWSLAEAARMERLLHDEPDHVFGFLLQRLGLRAERAGDEYRLRFDDYLRLARGLTHEVGWKLVNQRLERGLVYLTRGRLSRLIRQYLYESLVVNKPPKPTKLPPKLAEIVAEVVERLQEIRSRQRRLKPTGRLPPCMAAIRERLADAGHTENFVYAAYMLQRGSPIDEVVQEFSVRSDFDEKIARYQIEHIAGLRGSRIKYRPPSCSRMRELGLCIRNGELCPRNIMNPLDY